MQKRERIINARNYERNNFHSKHARYLSKHSPDLSTHSHYLSKHSPDSIVNLAVEDYEGSNRKETGEDKSEPVDVEPSQIFKTIISLLNNVIY